PRPPRPAARVPAGRLGAARHRGPGSTHARRVRGPAHRHAHLPGGRTVLLLPAATQPRGTGRLGMITLLKGPRRPSPAPHGTPLISVRDAVVEFGDRRILDGIDLDIRTGEVLAIVGPNGAGKSTLLNVITGDAELVRGTVSVDGAAWHAWSGRELAMRRAVLLQQVDVSFPFTALEVAEMGRSPWANLPESQHDDRIVAGALARTETQSFTTRKYSSLSGGERARVALSRVLAQTAAAMLLDEPTAAL